MSIGVGILGASGYGGAGLIERLLRHPEVEIRGLGTRQHVGRPATAAWPQLAGLTDLTFSAQNEVIETSDVVFCATPHRATAPLVAQARSVGASVIDLSADFRIPPSQYARWYGVEHPHPELFPEARYGLVELHREELCGAAIVAAPGCNATAVSLALAPLAAEGLLGPEVNTSVITGASGAGRGVAEDFHFSELNESARPYKVGGKHRHIAEIEATLGRVTAMGKSLSTHAEVPGPTVTFTPHLVPMTRGILATCVTRPENNSLDGDGLLGLYLEYYAGDPLIHVQPQLPTTKAVTGSDRVLVSVQFDPRTGSVIAFAAIDNLGKGAAGQAVQGFNAAFGLNETLGLALAGGWP